MVLKLYKKTNNILKIVGLMLLFVQVTGCLSPVARNLGATDYKVARSGSDSQWLEKYRKVDSNSVVRKGESISITLQQGFIDDFSERLERITSALQFTKVRGEIAILAKVYEVDGINQIQYGNDFQKGARLVFYSDDVRSGGQPLNFASMPLYGPVTYNGGPLVIELAILELDFQETAQLKGVLNQLVKFGQVALAPSAPELQLLDSIGSQLLDGDQDDWELSYKFILYPSTGSHLVDTAILEVGNYVLINEKVTPVPGFRVGIDALNADSPYKGIEWNKYIFNAGSGRVTKDGKTPDNTYLVLQIDKGHSPLEMDLLESFEDFRAKMLSSFEKKNSLNLTSIEEAANAFSKKMQSKSVDAIIEEQLQISNSLIAEYANDQNVLMRKLLATRLYNVLIEKLGFPKTKDGKELLRGLSSSQHQQVLRSLYSIVKDPEKFPTGLNKSNFKATSDFTELLK